MKRLLPGILSARFFRPACLLAFIALVLASPALAQNIVENGDAPAFEARALTAQEKALFRLDPGLKFGPVDDRLQPYARRLEAEVNALIDGWPWRPFFHQLGISGAETHFDHPDELFAVLAEALPVLPSLSAKRAREFLVERLREIPPYAVEGFNRSVGRPRERYSVPEGLRAEGRRDAADAWGVHAFFNYLRAAQELDTAKEHWPAIKARMGPLLEREYAFDPKKTTYSHGEAQRLNGDLSGLYATMHLAKIVGDEAMRERASARAEQLLQLRLNFERVNPHFLERADTATKMLHHYKAGRYLHLPEPAIAMLASDGTAAKRIRPFREARPGWWMAFGDRYIGGENYTTSPDFGRAIFIAATQIEGEPFFALTNLNEIRLEPAMQWLDIPWCKADLYFIERLALILQTPFGR